MAGSRPRPCDIHKYSFIIIVNLEWEIRIKNNPWDCHKIIATFLSHHYRCTTELPSHVQIVLQKLIMQQIGPAIWSHTDRLDHSLNTHHVLDIQERVIDGDHRHLVLLKSSPHHKSADTAKSKSRKEARNLYIKLNVVDTTSGFSLLPSSWSTQIAIKN